MNFPNPDDFAADLFDRASYELLFRLQNGLVPFGRLVMYFRVLREFAEQIEIASAQVPESERAKWVDLAEGAYVRAAVEFMSLRLEAMRQCAPRGKKLFRTFAKDTLPFACVTEIFPHRSPIALARRESLHKAMHGLAELAGLAPPKSAVAELRQEFHRPALFRLH